MTNINPYFFCMRIVADGVQKELERRVVTHFAISEVVCGFYLPGATCTYTICNVTCIRYYAA